MRKALFRFFQLSCASAVTNWGLTLGLHEWGKLPEEVAFAMALAAVLVLNFFVLRWYIYETPAGTSGTSSGSICAPPVGFARPSTGPFSSGTPGTGAIIASQWRALRSCPPR
jgi:hypothetical protein